MGSDHVSIDLENKSVSSGESSDLGKFNHSSKTFSFTLEKLPSYREEDNESNRLNADNHEHSRSPLHWFRSMIRGKTLSWKPMLISVLWSSVAVAVSKLASRDFPQEGCRWFCTRLALDATTHSYVGFALFLLLGFRVNESYQRYLDGLKLWTRIAGTVCSMSKYFLQAFPQGFFHKGDRERILSWLVSFPIALKHELRNERSLCKLKVVLSPKDLERLENARSMSSHTLYVLSAYIVKALDMKNGPAQTLLLQLITGISSLREYAAHCNQIKRMPCAFSYVAHLRVFLLVWLALLPFTIVEKIAWGVRIANSISKAVLTFWAFHIEIELHRHLELLRVELNAQELENPFGHDYNDLPLGMFAEQIFEGVREKYMATLSGTNTYVRESETPEPEEGEAFWLEVVEE